MSIILGETNVLHAAYFLDVRSLAALDQACSLSPVIRERYWEEAAIASVKGFPVWSGTAATFIQQVLGQKKESLQHVRDVSLLRRTILPAGKRQACIRSASFCSLKVSPYWDPEMEDQLIAGRQWNVEALPIPTAVPVSLGSFRKQALVVGLTIRPEGQLEDKLRIGVEGRSAGKTTPLMIAPFSGHCFLQLGRKGPSMKASVLKPLEKVPQSLSIWIKIFESGCIRFWRQVEDGAPEDAGLLPSASLPRWIEEYFVCIYHWGEELGAAATISVDHASESFPAWFPDKPAVDMDVIWELTE